jgi:hypothetical protein
VYSSTEKKTQPVKPGSAWIYGLWENMVYVSLDIERKHDKNAKVNKLEFIGKDCTKTGRLYSLEKVFSW